MRMLDGRSNDLRLGIGIAAVFWIPTLLWLVPHVLGVAAEGILTPYAPLLGGVVAVFAFLAWFFPDLFVSLLFGLHVRKNYQGILFWFGLLPSIATIILALRAGLVVGSYLSGTKP